MSIPFWCARTFSESRTVVTSLSTFHSAPYLYLGHGPSRFHEQFSINTVVAFVLRPSRMLWTAGEKRGRLPYATVPDSLKKRAGIARCYSGSVQGMELEEEDLLLFGNKFLGHTSPSDFSRPPDIQSGITGDLEWHHGA